MKRKDAKRRWRPGLLLGVALMLAVGALVLAGCGGGSSSGSTTESSTTASSSGSEGSSAESSGSEGSESEGKKGGTFDISEEAKACLKEKGVELPEFKAGAGGPPSGGEAEPPEGGEKPSGKEGFGGEKFEEMQEAFKECGVEFGGLKGGPGGAGGKPNVNSAAFKKQVKEYAACVRENGYEIAEPNFSGEGPVFEKSESESAAFKKASASCESFLKGGGSRESESG